MQRPAVALTLAGALLLATGSAALATTTKIPDVGQEHVTSGVGSVPPTLSGSIMSVRNEHHVAYLTAIDGVTVTGSETTVANWELDVVTLTGRLWGTSQIVPLPLSDPAVGGMNCVFDGTFVPGTFGGAWTAHSVCHGYGVLAGWQSRSDATSQVYGSSFVGYKFVPANKVP
jgi:hypothetical protein